MKKLILMAMAVMAVFASMTACTKNKEAKKDMKQTVDNNKGEAKDQKILVAYFSATGTTEGVAKMIAEATGGELYRIQPKEEYSAADLDWNEPTSRCCKEHADKKARPEILKKKAGLKQYEVVYLGFPNWWNEAPRIVNSFIEAYDLSDKAVIPFMTSGGSDITNSEHILKKEYPAIDWREGKLLNDASQGEVAEWVKSLK